MVQIKLAHALKKKIQSVMTQLHNGCEGMQLNRLKILPQIFFFLNFEYKKQVKLFFRTIHLNSLFIFKNQID
jgi:hypothetical protein